MRYNRDSSLHRFGLYTFNSAKKDVQMLRDLGFPLRLIAVATKHGMCTVVRDLPAGEERVVAMGRTWEAYALVRAYIQGYEDGAEEERAGEAWLLDDYWDSVIGSFDVDTNDWLDKITERVLTPAGGEIKSMAIKQSTEEDPDILDKL